MELTTLFSPNTIGNIEVKNRIIRSATYDRMATEDGRVTDHLLQFYTDLASGGVGLIFTGGIAINSAGVLGASSLVFSDDSYIKDNEKLVTNVRDASPDVKIGAQICHSGPQSLDPAQELIAPSTFTYESNGRVARELTVDEIWNLISEFIAAGRRTFESGYDLVQLHAAHGYLLSSFLSPRTNAREDEFGGSVGNRARILAEICKGIHSEAGANFPIAIKLQTQDGIPDGLELAEATEIARIVVDAGCAAIEVSGGTGETLLRSGWGMPSSVVKTTDDENYFLPAAQALKDVIPECRIILVGGIRNPVSAEQILQENQADFISMSRPLICEPDLPNRWFNGDHEPALCSSCNSCYQSLMSGPVECLAKRALLRKKKKAMQ
ncbi:MAG TPA: NADH:flavin oxidoreductase [Candidatus Lokiarchaeia archaeon]|nr:NADH:flavin oxidoreductase [Candidatus Lokiarchaeia archaeon]